MELPKSVFNKVAGLRLGTLFKKETLAQAFSCEFCEIFNSTFFIEHLRWLLLKCELQWNLPIADIPNSWHAFKSGNLKIFVELPPNTGQRKIAVTLKRDLALPGWNFLHIIAGYNLWRVYNTSGSSEFISLPRKMGQNFIASNWDQVITT